MFIDDPYRAKVWDADIKEQAMDRAFAREGYKGGVQQWRRQVDEDMFDRWWRANSSCSVIECHTLSIWLNRCRRSRGVHVITRSPLVAFANTMHWTKAAPTLTILLIVRMECMQWPLQP
jgi:hypothetical protein